jgi:hypothetical protein
MPASFPVPGDGQPRALNMEFVVSCLILTLPLEPGSDSIPGIMFFEKRGRTFLAAFHKK